MVPSEEMGPLALYLEKQRELRRISEELEQLKSNRTIEAAMRIKHEIDALLADYELTPEQLLEALCTLFDLAKPYGYEGDGLEAKASPGGRADAGQAESKNQGDRSGEQGGNKSAVRQRGNRGAKSKTEPPSATGGSLVPAKKVTISTRSPKKPTVDSGVAKGPEQGASSSAQEKLASKPVGSKVPGGRRQTRKYTNPHTGEVVKTRGGNHRVLNEWRKRYGADVVDGWWVVAEAG